MGGSVSAVGSYDCHSNISLKISKKLSSNNIAELKKQPSDKYTVDMLEGVFLAKLERDLLKNDITCESKSFSSQFIVKFVINNNLIEI